MINAFYSGREGLRARQTAMDTVSNNIANLNTTGFKAQQDQFSDVLYTSMNRPDSADYGNLLVGNGTAVSQIESDMSDGGTDITGRLLDFRPSAGGFFAVEDGAGNRYYTQDGSFGLQTGANGTELVNAQGLFVLDAGGNRIGAADGLPREMPGVYTFSNSQGLAYEGGNLFSQTARSGAAVAGGEALSGGLAGSNVDLSKEMTDMIVTQRGFQFSSRVVQTADQIETMVNDLKG